MSKNSPSASEFIEKYKVTDPDGFRLADYPTRPDFFDDSDIAEDYAKGNAKTLDDWAHRLYAEKREALLIVLQGMDTSGKDGTTESCFEETPPLNVYVAPFKAPSKRELAHDYLWRVHQVCPELGQICVFNRSHYEDVLVVKVRNFAPAEKVEQRYEQINNFEKHLTQNGTHILKFMLNISYETQGERLRERLEEPHKRWKFNPGDLDDRALWPDFMAAYETMVQRTSTDYAPWYVIPADSRSRRGAIVSAIIRDKLEQMNPIYPDPGYRPGDFEID